MEYNRKVVFWAACAGMLLFGVCMITLGSVASDLREKLKLNELAFRRTLFDTTAGNYCRLFYFRSDC